MNKKYIIILILVLVTALVGSLVFLFGRQKSTEPVAVPGRIHVVASFYPLYFFASEIGGEYAKVTNITPSGAEPHDYEPTPNEIAGIEQANVLILNGGGLEVWGDSIRSNIDPTHTQVVIAGEGLTTQQVEEEGKSITDPHVWLAPPLAKQIVAKIEQGFVQADPSHAAYYTENTQALIKKLDDLDQEYKTGLADCKTKDIITSHSAFGYLAQVYWLHQVGIAGLSPEEEPSPKQLADIAKFAKTNNVKVIFFESLVSPKLAQTIATEVGAQTMVLDPIEGVSDDDRVAGKNYFTIMQDNLANIRTALACTL